MNRVIKEFEKRALVVFAATLDPYGFKLESKKREQHWCSIVFVNGERYVTIETSTYPRDYPPCFNVILGEGPRGFVEADWNSIALWRLKNFILSSTAGAEYRLSTLGELSGQLRHAKNELLEFGAEFLAGDTRSFRHARSEQNKNREPYMIYAMGENGKLIAVEEPESVKMKEKYS